MGLLLGFLGLLSALLLTGIAGLIGHDLWASHREARGEVDRRSETTRRWLAVAEASPGDPAAWSRLGDALRSDDLPEQAIEAWRRAMQTASTASATVSEDWPHKIRMAQRDIEERSQGKWQARTLSQREQPCRTCGAIAPPDARACGSCGAPLPVDSIDQVVRNPALRRALSQEGRPILLRFGATALAFAIAPWLPTELRVVLTLATLAVIPFWLLRRFGEG